MCAVATNQPVGILSAAQVYMIELMIATTARAPNRARQLGGMTEEGDYEEGTIVIYRGIAILYVG